MSHWGHRVESLAMEGQGCRRTPWNDGTMALGLHRNARPGTCGITQPGLFT